MGADAAPTRGVVDLSVEQARPHGRAVAIGFLEPAVCDGTPQPFEATLTRTAGPRFRPGPATWSASGYVEGDGGLQSVFVPATPIRLR